MPPRVSILVPLYNHERYIAQTLSSICVQTMPDFEVIVVNDGSTDASATIAAQFAQQDSRISIYHQKNAGLVATMNRLASLACGEFIATIDSDDFYAPRRLEWGLQLMEREPNLAASFCSVLVVDGESRPCQGRAELLRGPITGQAFIDRLVVSNFVASSGSLIRASALCGIGPFARDFEQIPDWDLWLRIAQKGHLSLQAEIGTFVRWDGNNMSSKSAALSSEMQLLVSKEVVPKVASFHHLSKKTWAAIHTCRAAHAQSLKNFDLAIEELASKARLGFLSGKDYGIFASLLLTAGRNEAALQFMHAVLSRPRAVDPVGLAEVQHLYCAVAAKLRSEPNLTAG